jgi:hypothetical protein
VEELSIREVDFVRETTRVNVTYVPRTTFTPEPDPEPQPEGIDALEPARV